MHRRRPDPERVRHTLRNVPPEYLLNEYGEEIVRLRGAIKQALDMLDADLVRSLTEARVLLRDTLERKR